MSGMMGGRDPARFMELRQDIGWDRLGCALALGVSVDTVRNWDKGRRECPPEVLEWMQVLADMIEAGPPGRKLPAGDLIV